MKYEVAFRVTGEFDVAVEAGSSKEAIEKATDIYFGTDFGNLRNIEANAVQVDFAEKLTNAKLEELWEEFGDVPMNPETECIEADFLGFPSGTHREEIWHWFDEKYSGGVHSLMYPKANSKHRKTGCTISGYGFRVYVSDENLHRFIMKHEDTIRDIEDGPEVLLYCKEHPCPGEGLHNIKEVFYDWVNESTGDTGLYGLIADVMSHETGIPFDYRNAGADDEDDAILLEKTFPWQNTENSRRDELTFGRLKDILQSYIEDLGGQLKHQFIELVY